MDDDIVDRMTRWLETSYEPNPPEDALLILDARKEIDRLRALIVEWYDANNFGSLHGDDLTAAVDRLNASEKALIEEARRG